MAKDMTPNSAGHSANPRGFAAMDAERQKAIARKGGENVPKEKRSFSRNKALAVEAGRKGGLNVPADQRSFSKNPDLAAKAGKKGGESSQGPTRK
jgi:general stress protein YciG